VVSFLTVSPPKLYVLLSSSTQATCSIKIIFGGNANHEAPQKMQNKIFTEKINITCIFWNIFATWER
jgi:hypothetical protein